jgi:hypothetical protein
VGLRSLDGLKDKNIIGRLLDWRPIRLRKRRGNGWGAGQLAGLGRYPLPDWERTARNRTGDTRTTLSRLRAKPVSRDECERSMPDEK